MKFSETYYRRNIEDKEKQKLEEEIVQIIQVKKTLQDKIIALEKDYSDMDEINALEQLHEYIRQLLLAVADITRMIQPTINTLKDNYAGRINQEDGNAPTQNDFDPKEREKLEAEVKVLFSILFSEEF